MFKDLLPVVSKDSVKESLFDSLGWEDRDHLNYDEFRDTLISGKLEILDIGAKVFKINTTDFSSIGLKEVYDFFDERGCVDN